MDVPHDDLSKYTIYLYFGNFAAKKLQFSTAKQIKGGLFTQNESNKYINHKQIYVSNDHYKNKTSIC